MNLNEIIARLAEIEAEAETRTGDELAALEEEQRNLIEQRNALQADAQRRAAMRNAAGALGLIIEQAPEPDQNRRTLEEVRSSHEYAVAYADYIRTENPAQVRALLSDLVNGGTVPTPTMVQEAIETAWRNAQLVSRIRKTYVPGTLKVPFELSATAAVAHTEGAAAPDPETLTLGTVSIVPVMLKKWIQISDEVVALKGEAFLAYINAEIAQRIAELADATLVAKIQATPATATSTAVSAPALTIEEITCDTIFQALALLADGAKNPVAIMNRQTYFGKFMALKDLQNRPIYNVVSENGKPTYYINGVEVIFSAALTADTEIIVGDLDGALANFPEGEGIVFKYDDKSLMEADLVKILGREYVGIGIVKPDYFVNITVDSE